MAADSKLPVGADNRSFVVLGIAALCVIIGSLGPWATVWIVTVNGTAGDGQITLVLGLVAGAVLAWQHVRPSESRKRDVGLVACFVPAALVGIYDWLNISRVASETGFGASVAWGLPLMTVAAIVGTIAAANRIRSQACTTELPTAIAVEES